MDNTEIIKEYERGRAIETIAKQYRAAYDKSHNEGEAISLKEAEKHVYKVIINWVTGKDS